MSNLDSLLTFMKESDADELRLGTGQPPQMLSRGVPKRLTIAATDDTTLRFLLSDVLTSDAESRLRTKGEIEVTYDAGPLGKYCMELRVRNDPSGLEAVVWSESRPAPQAMSEPRPLKLPGVTVAVATPVSTSPLEPASPEAPSRAPRRAVPAESGSETTVRVALLGMLRQAVRLRASDIHLAHGARPCLRIDGVLECLAEDAEADLVGLLGLTPADSERLGRGASVEFAISEPGGGSARVHVYSTADGLAAAIRLLPPHAPSLESLRLPLPLDDLVSLPHGLVLVCGASGSGKSTTVAALAQAALLKRSIVLITLEDPIEYVLEAGPSSLVRRRQIGRDVSSFAEGLRDALRENPDLLLVGELRDAEAIQMAVTAAETGHLVLATLHARSAPSAITRLVDSYPPAQQEHARRQLAESLRVVAAQRLVACARPPGRIPALEVLRVNQAASSLIREGKTSQLGSVMQAAKGEGMLWLERCLADQVKQGLITLEAAKVAANDPASLALQLGPSAPRS